MKNAIVLSAFKWPCRAISLGKVEGRFFRGRVRHAGSKLPRFGYGCKNEFVPYTLHEMKNEETRATS